MLSRKYIIPAPPFTESYILDFIRNSFSVLRHIQSPQRSIYHIFLHPTTYLRLFPKNTAGKAGVKIKKLADYAYTLENFEYE